MRTKIYILETESELKRLLSQETDGRIKEKLQALYWLKTKKLSRTVQKNSKLVTKSKFPKILFPSAFCCSR